MKTPNQFPGRHLDRDKFVEFLQPVPKSLYDPKVLDFISPGAKIPIFHDEPLSFPRENNPILEGHKLIAAGVDIAQNIFNRRWFGPFPASYHTLKITTLDGSVRHSPPCFLPYFLISKKDKTKWRWISDAKRPIPGWQSKQPEPSMEWFEFNACAPIRSINENTFKMDIQFEKLTFILRSLIGKRSNASFVAGADARGGYKQLFRHPDTWHLIAYFLRFRSPDGTLLEFWVVNPCNAMGLTNSAQIFESCFQLFTLGLYFNFPSLFYTEEEKAWRQIFSWLDDLINSSAHHSIRQAWELALQAFVVTRWAADFVGIMLAPGKDQPPSQFQEVLGFEVNTYTKRLLLKPKKANEYTLVISEFIKKGVFDTKVLESIHGKLNHASFITPIIRALLPPLTEAYSQDKCAPRLRLRKEVLSVLKIILPILSIDPSCDFKRFCNDFQQSFPTSYTDASGFESTAENPYPGGLAALTPGFRPPPSRFVGEGFCFWYTAWFEILHQTNFFAKAAKILADSHFPSSKSSSNALQPPIGYLELLTIVLHLVFLFIHCSINANGKCLVFVTDSMCCLFWLTSSRLKRFPWYRLSPILPLFEQCFHCKIIIRWTPSEFQPADKASRGITHLNWRNKKLVAAKLPVVVAKKVLSILFCRSALTKFDCWHRLCSSLDNPDFSKISTVPSLSPVFSTALHDLIRQHPLAFRSKKEKSNISKWLLALLLSARAPGTWKYTNKRALAVFRNLYSPKLWHGTQGLLFLASLAAWCVQIHNQPTDKSRAELHRWFKFIRTFNVNVYCLESDFTVELVRLITQGANKLKFKQPINKHCPLSPTQLFLLIWSLTPPGRKVLDNHLQTDTTSSGIIAALLVGSLGFRFGEILPHNCLAINREYTAHELFGIPRIDDLLLYIPQGTTMLGSLQSVAEQKKALRACAKLTSASAAFRCKRTKMGWPRYVALTHFHLFGSTILCVLCRCIQALLIRLSIQSVPFRSKDFFFSFPYKTQWRPVTFKMVATILSRVSQQHGWSGVVCPHDFKRGALAYISVDVDARDTSVLLSIGDHRPSYIKKYQILPTVLTSRILHQAREKAIVAQLSSLFPPRINKTLPQILGKVAPLFSSSSHKTKTPPARRSTTGTKRRREEGCAWFFLKRSRVLVTRSFAFHELIE